MTPTNRAFQRLGIEPTDDVRAIKSAYAALLRKTRPEHDPAAFQLLAHAYEAALDWARGHLPGAVDPGAADAASQQVETVSEAEPTAVADMARARKPGPAPAASGPAHDPMAIVEEILTRCATPGLSDWLEARTALQDLGFKACVGQALARRLDALPWVPDRQGMAALAAQFAWEPLASDSVVRRLLARAAAHAQLVEDVRHASSPDLEWRAHGQSALLLLRPFDRLAHTRWAARLIRAGRMQALLRRLDVESEFQIERLIDRRTLEFWHRWPIRACWTETGWWSSWRAPCALASCSACCPHSFSPTRSRRVGLRIWWFPCPSGLAWSSRCNA